MKRLILMRHAKSDWSLGTADQDRPLNSRGRRSAEAVGLWMRDMGYAPEEVLCSSAARTRETLDRLALKKAPTSYQKAMYLAEADKLLDILRKATGDSVLMLAHNPGIGDFAHVLVAEGADHPRWNDYPTCATMIADFDIDDWSALTPGTGTLVDFVVGRDLTD